jgi:hypothetical protein
MTFDSLINFKMREEEIFYRVVDILRSNFLAYQEAHVILELGEADGDFCAVKSVKLYSIHKQEDIDAKRKFILQGEYENVYVFTKFINDFYRLSFLGHFTLINGDVYRYGVEDVRVSKSPVDFAKQKKLPFELIVGAFAEIEAELKKKIS